MTSRIMTLFPNKENSRNLLVMILRGLFPLTILTLASALEKVLHLSPAKPMDRSTMKTFQVRMTPFSGCLVRFFAWFSFIHCGKPVSKFRVSLAQPCERHGGKTLSLNLIVHNLWSEFLSKCYYLWVPSISGNILLFSVIKIVYIIVLVLLWLFSSI